MNSIGDVFLQRADAAERKVEALREQLTSDNKSSPAQTRIDSTPYTVPALPPLLVHTLLESIRQDLKLLYMVSTNKLNHCYNLIKYRIINVSLEHTSSHKQHRYICSNSQQYIVWVNIIHFSFMPKIIRIL